MHDLLEGVCPLEILLVLNELIHQKIVTLDQINGQIVSFSYGFADAHNRPNIISESVLQRPDGSIGQTASQTWCLIRNLPLMIGDVIPHENWEFSDISWT